MLLQQYLSALNLQYWLTQVDVYNGLIAVIILYYGSDEVFIVLVLFCLLLLLSRLG